MQIRSQTTNAAFGAGRRDFEHFTKQVLYATGLLATEVARALTRTCQLALPPFGKAEAL